MIISVGDARGVIGDAWSDKKLKRKLKAIESTIRKYTNNNFQNRNIRFEGAIMAGSICGGVTGLNAGDTIQISESKYNDGLYVISSIDELNIKTEEDLIDETHILVTKVVYPEDVIECCYDLLEWEKDFGKKVGIKSETLSRHSVTYEDSSTLYMGYPIGILNGLSLRKKARF